MAQALGIGPAHILISTGDPTSASNWIDLGSMESVSFDPGVQMTGVQDAFSGDAYDSESIYSVAPTPQVTAELYDHAIEKIAAMVSGGETKGGAFGFGQSGLSEVTAPMLAVIPSFEAEDGAEAEHGIWLPAVSLESLASIVYNRPTPGGNSANSYTATFRGARCRKLNGVDLPAKFQFAWIGDPSDVTDDLEIKLPVLG